MKIRFEKLEIEVPREMVDSVGVVLLKLREFDARLRATEESSRQMLLSALLNIGVELIRSTFKLQETPPAPPAAQTEPGDIPEPGHTSGD